MVGRGEVAVGGPPLRAGVVTATRLSGCQEGRARGGRLPVTGRVGARGPAWWPVVVGVARAFAAPATGVHAPGGHSGRSPGVALQPVFVLVSPPPVAPARWQVWLVMLIAVAEPNAQNDGDEDDHENGHEADYEQDHRTTQLARPSG